MGLDEYRRKRNFTTTPEPKDIYSNEHKFRFVVQRHRASHLHYDLRLEIAGVLKSWAIPKGPSMNPKDKRLAVHTEDHPVNYLTFEGVIPKGNYGAGKMTIWDSGYYESLYDNAHLITDYTSGKLKLTFQGNKLKGLFTLVRSSAMHKKNQWLLIKHQDEVATSLNYNAENYITEGFNTTSKSLGNKIDLKSYITPMLASPAKEIFNNKDWIYELKYDGYRALANIDSGRVELYSRNGISLNETFKAIHTDLNNIEHSAILDGEIVILDKKGIPQFNALQNYNPKTTKGHLAYYVFDVLFLNGHDTTELPLINRKELLKNLLPDTSHISYCDHVEGMGITVYNQAIELGMEGIIAKKANSKYYTNSRSPDWLKFKKIENTEAIICGFTLSKTKSRKFASLILGMVKNEELIYVGTCGSGFSDNEIDELYKKFEVYITERPVFEISQHLKGRKPVWMLPKLICEVKFSEWTPNNIMRQPIFLRLREDKSVTVGKINVSSSKHEINKMTKAPESSLRLNNNEVPITNIDKLYWPNANLTKYDLLDYYIKMSDVILPYLKDRPQSLHRHPNGIQGESFYQKDNDNLPAWVETIPIYSKSSEREINYLLCQNEATLLYMNNLGCIELHPWHSTMYQLDKPDYSIIDLDPSEDNNFEQVIETAQAVKFILNKARIKGYCKTSGSKGLHIYIPLGGNYTYAEARDFTKLLCIYIQEQLPDLTTLERSIKKRGSKIYLDYLQNRKGQTIASAYSVRPRPNATVSTPLLWNEVKSGLRIEDYTIKTVPQHIENTKDRFKKILGKGIDMEAALKNLSI
ncbi:DNA ligase D [Winogradskyella bathintestinalis]|uniref:DNA ligase (ATP) n=1 Tax=Winogradskyella bathintestinalis TaxID=3035208 RepID=A0ABT7ZW39_9FLAO|nr:DNA ligase D [Winogradskyella bathintestinalis]MDN3493221.1 DNA ligase D [Winogradskyella bathintestinalis]